MPMGSQNILTPLRVRQASCWRDCEPPRTAVSPPGADAGPPAVDAAHIPPGSGVGYLWEERAVQTVVLQRKRLQTLKP